jgi:hypothetical protein
MDTYTIYIINNAVTTETFWLFLAQPILSNTQTIYANSSASVTIESNANSINRFVIPIQYLLYANGSNNAIGVNVEVDSTIIQNVQIGDTGMATFYTEINQAPDLTLLNPSPPLANNEIGYQDNTFDPNQEIQNSWYASQGFGIQAQSGLIGTTWEALPSTTVNISPILKFYINTGNYRANQLADFTTIQNESASIETMQFSGFEATVTLNDNGTFTVTSGAPQNDQE